MEQNKIIGYTTGVFDMFHIGHLNILKLARENCDYLIAGVSTDELSLSQKNKLPVIPFAERLEIIRSIRYVDMAVAQETMDKMAAWEKYRFDVMFAGSDWQGTPAWNKHEQQFAKVGVKVVYFPYTGHISSTLLREKIGKPQRTP